MIGNDGDQQPSPGGGNGGTTLAQPSVPNVTSTQSQPPQIIDICGEDVQISSQNSTSNHMMKDVSFDTSNSKHKLSENDDSIKKDGTPKRQKLESLDSSESISSILCPLNYRRHQLSGSPITK